MTNWELILCVWTIVAFASGAALGTIIDRMGR